MLSVFAWRPSLRRDAHDRPAYDPHMSRGAALRYASGCTFALMAAAPGRRRSGARAGIAMGARNGSRPLPSLASSAPLRRPRPRRWRCRRRPRREFFVKPASTRAALPWYVERVVRGRRRHRRARPVVRSVRSSEAFKMKPQLPRARRVRRARRSGASTALYLLFVFIHTCSSRPRRNTPVRGARRLPCSPRRRQWRHFSTPPRPPSPQHVDPSRPSAGHHRQRDAVPAAPVGAVPITVLRTKWRSAGILGLVARAPGGDHRRHRDRPSRSSTAATSRGADGDVAARRKQIALDAADRGEGQRDVRPGSTTRSTLCATERLGNPSRRARRRLEAAHRRSSPTTSAGPPPVERPAAGAETRRRAPSAPPDERRSRRRRRRTRRAATPAAKARRRCRRSSSIRRSPPTIEHRGVRRRRARASFARARRGVVPDGAVVVDARGLDGRRRRAHVRACSTHRMYTAQLRRRRLTTPSVVRSWEASAVHATFVAATAGRASPTTSPAAVGRALRVHLDLSGTRSRRRASI